MHRGRVVADAAPRNALTPAVLREAFGLDGALVEVEGDLVLAARRAG